MRTCMVLLDWPRPEPWQVSHGWSTTRPRPLHSVHGSVMANTPPWTEVCIPVPSHFRQTFGTVPYFAPVPRQVLHGSSLVIRSATVTPLTASANSIVASVSMSAPRRGRAVDVEVEATARAAAARHPETAAAEQPARLVVLLALLGIADHVVRLGDLLEPGLSGGVPGVGVRVVLARQLAVGLLDLVGIGGLGDAENLVEVLLEPVLRAHPTPPLPPSGS